MHNHISHTGRCWLVLIFWLAGLVMLAGFGWWNLDKYHVDAENRLIGEAGRTASHLAHILALPVYQRDESTIKAIMAGQMDDERVYAIKVDTEEGITAGFRRNYLWEPVAWDDELAENCVQGMNTIKYNGQNEGRIDIWISPRLNAEEETLLAKREKLRFIAVAALWTIMLVFIMWQWGDLGRLMRLVRNRFNQSEPSSSEQKQSGGNHQPPSSGGDVVNAALGRKFQSAHPEAWLVTAGMFRQTFARGPALISRLYAQGETAGLCHLGRMLEQAAPCIGADKLAQAAREMQKALNHPECETRALPVEECAHALEEVLDALCGDGQWRSRPGASRS